MSIGATRTADRLNRRVLAGLGVLLTGAGAAALVAGSLDKTSDNHLINGRLADWASRWDRLLWVAAFVASVLATVLFLRWLLVQLRPLGGPRTLELGEAVDDADAVRVPAAALVEQLALDLEANPDVRSAKGRVVETSPISVTMAVVVDERFEITAARRYAADFVQRRAEHALGQPVTLDIEVSLAPTQPEARVA